MENFQKLSKDQIQQKLSQLKGWQFKNGKITKEFKFANFPTAILFVNKVVDPAEELNHHPQIAVNYNRVHILCFTHASGGLTDLDFKLAKMIDDLT